MSPANCCRRAGITLNTVQYRGGGPIITDLLSNQVQLTILSVAIAEPLIRDNRVGALMILAKQRTPQLPDLPSSAELGLPDLDQITLWFGLHAPKGTPDPIVQRVRSAVMEVMQLPQIRDRMATGALKAIGDTPEAFTARMESDLRLYGEIFRTANIRLEQ